MANTTAFAATTIPWQTSEEQVGIFAYWEGPIKVSPAVKGFAFAKGVGPDSKDFSSLDPYWQSALVVIEYYLDEARMMIQKHKRTTLSHDPWGDSCRALDALWIPKVNDRLKDTGYLLDCFSLHGPRQPSRDCAPIDYIFIRIHARQAGDTYSTDSSAMERISASKKNLSLRRHDFGRTAEDDDTAFHGESRSVNLQSKEIAHQSRDQPDVITYKDINAKVSNGTYYPNVRRDDFLHCHGDMIATGLPVSDQELALHEEQLRCSHLLQQIEKLTDRVAQEVARNHAQEESMEDLLVHLRAERLQKEEQAETISRLERKLQQATQECNSLQCQVTSLLETSPTAREPKKRQDGRKKKKKKKNKNSGELLLYTGGLLLLLWLPIAQAATRGGPSGNKFEVYGPVLTLHLKDSLSNDVKDLVAEPRSNLPTIPATAKSLKPWINDWASLRPALSWSIRSTPQPWKSAVPALQQVRADINYKASANDGPISVQTTTRWGLPGNVVLHVQPTLQLKNPLAATSGGGAPLLLAPSSSSVWIQLRRGAQYVWTKVKQSSAKDPVSVTAQANVAVPLPTEFPLDSLQVTPSYDGTTVATMLTATFKGPSSTSRTRPATTTQAILDLPYATRPRTLTIQHALNDRHVVSPQINLQTGHIVYQWDVALSDTTESSLRTRIDPLHGIAVTWTDASASGGSWVTDIRLPLEGTTMAALAADIRIRRQFQF